MSTIMCRDHRVFSSSGNLSDVFVLESRFRTRSLFQNSKFTVRSMKVSEQNQTGKLASSNGPLTASVSSFHARLFFLWTAYPVWILRCYSERDENTLF